MPGDIDVSVVIVTYNSSSTIGETLESVCEQDFEEEYEVRVIDGGSEDRTIEIADSFDVSIHQLDGATIGECRNQGITLANGEYVAFTDSDCRVPSNWLSKLYGHLQGSGEPIVGVGGPNIPFPDDPPLTHVVNQMQKSVFGSGGASQAYGHSDVEIVDNLAACNVLYDLEEISGEAFDPSINVGEDAEFHHRLSKAGKRFLFDPSIVVHHHLPATLGEFIDKNFTYGSAMAQIQLKHREIIRWYSALPSLLIIYLLYVPFGGWIFGELIPVLGIISWAIVSLSLSIKSYNSTGYIQSLLIPLLLPLQYFSYGAGFFSGIVSSRK